MPIKLKEGAKVSLTRNYRDGWFGKLHKQGSGGIVTRLYKGFTGVYVDLRMEDGSFIRKIPYEYFRV